MASTKSEIAELFDIGLKKLLEEVEHTPQEVLWKSPAGISNSCGVLAQHLAGNLNHFVGEGLGRSGYQRDRDREFVNKERPRAELVDQLRQTRSMIQTVVGELDDQQLQQPYPMKTPFDYTTGKFLFHLYGHLNYHLGQYNYLRRLLNEKEG